MESNERSPCQLFAGDEIVPSFASDMRRTSKLFLPIFLGQIATTCMSVVDTVMSGMAGATQLAGVAIGASLFWPGVLFLVGMSLTIQPTVAQLRGAGKTELIPQKMHLATVIILITSVIVGIILGLLSLIYKMIPGADPEMAHVGQWYLISVSAGMPAFAMYNILRGYWEGLGNTLPTSVFGFIALVLNIPLNYIFIFGFFGIPAFGGIGCGIATSLTMYLTCIFMYLYVRRAKCFARFRIYEHSFPIKKQDVKDLLHFGIPLAFSLTVEVTCFSLVSLLLSPFGPIIVASHSIAMNVSAFIFMIPMALASATTIRVGEAMGALHWRRAMRTTLGSFILGGIFFVLSISVLLITREQIVDLYTDDKEVMLLGSLLLIFCAFYQLPDFIQAIAIGVLRGFKDSKVIFAITIVAYWIAGMPVGYILAHGLFTGNPMAAQGFWIGFITSLTVASILYIIRIVYLFKTHNLPKTFHISVGE